MAKIRSPLFSREVSGKITNLVYSSWRGIPYVRSKGDLRDPKTKKQKSCRFKFAVANGIWSNLPKEKKEYYNQRARFLPMTGQNLFVQEYMQGKVML